MSPNDPKTNKRLTCADEVLIFSTTKERANPSKDDNTETTMTMKCNRF